MPGEMTKARLSPRDPYLASRSQPWEVLSLPIFRDPLFDPLEHRVRNWSWYPNQGFAGEDSYGWGIHENGLVDCVCFPGDPGSDNIAVASWSDLVSMAGYAKDWKAGEGRAQVRHEMAELIIRRYVIQVQLAASDTKQLLDPLLWNVVVTRSSSIARPEPKPSLSTDLEKIRNGSFKLREPFADFGRSRP